MTRIVEPAVRSEPLRDCQSVARDESAEAATELWEDGQCLIGWAPDDAVERIESPQVFRIDRPDHQSIAFVAQGDHLVAPRDPGRHRAQAIEQGQFRPAPVRCFCGGALHYLSGVLSGPDCDSSLVHSRRGLAARFPSTSTVSAPGSSRTTVSGLSGTARAAKASSSVP